MKAFLACALTLLFVSQVDACQPGVGVRVYSYGAAPRFGAFLPYEMRTTRTYVAVEADPPQPAVAYMAAPVYVADPAPLYETVVKTKVRHRRVRPRRVIVTDVDAGVYGYHP